MAIGPILASLRAHRTPATLIVLEIALACAVLCNAVSMISQNVGDIRLPNAIDERGITIVSLNGVNPAHAADDVARNVTALRAIGGVRAAAAISDVPLDGDGLVNTFNTQMDSGLNSVKDVPFQYYFAGEGTDKAFGLTLIEGRFFKVDEYAGNTLNSGLMPTGHVVVVTKSYAQRMWPGQQALGKTVYSNPLWYTVVGVVADVLCPDDGLRGSSRPRGFYYSVFFPVRYGDVTGARGVGSNIHYYVLRSTPSDQGRVAREALNVLRGLNPETLAVARRYTDMRDQYFSDTSSMAWMLVTVCAVMLAVTAFGIVGLTSFWVQQRRRQIGIRRAVGATRGQILAYFRLENFLLTTVGVLIGMAMAFGVNLFLMKHYEMRLMPWYYLPAGAGALWVLGQLAVWGPALRAAAVPPVVATRSL
jgi:putative ABC transport system permease protein